MYINKDLQTFIYMYLIYSSKTTQYFTESDTLEQERLRRQMKREKLKKEWLKKEMEKSMSELGKFRFRFCNPFLVSG